MYLDEKKLKQYNPAHTLHARTKSLKFQKIAPRICELAELSAVSTSKLGIFDLRWYPLKGGILIP